MTTSDALYFFFLMSFMGLMAGLVVSVLYHWWLA